MIRFFLRFIGLLSLAAGFILVIYDGTRSIAGNFVSITSVRTLWETINASSLQSLRPLIEDKIGPWAWEPVFSSFLTAPSSAVFFIVGIIFVLLGRKRRPMIGYAR